MVLSNAERQRRHRERLKQAAREGVTPEDVRRVGRVIVDAVFEEGDPYFEWSNWKAQAMTRRGRDQWPELFRSLRVGDIEDGQYGDDTDLVRRVAAVAEAMNTLSSDEA
jgi:hypothetical protein